MRLSPSMDDADQLVWYIENVGRPPPPPRGADDPLAWQWSYRGSRAERARLAASLGSLDACRSRPRPAT